MNMTHYMGLLADNQPWNLLIFMAVPVICAEILAISEIAILFTRKLDGALKKLNKVTGIFAGFYFTGIFIYLMKVAYIPLTVNREWKGWIDVVAVTFYLLGIIPFLGMALLDLGLIYRNKTEEEKLKIHAIFVSIFLVVAHIAMIFGMIDPALGTGGHSGHDMSNM
ncbi:DUF6803 family protein [Neobacillus drentensis]|uniref:DUF6803 family protein n=1 Tax=Neobacillus drentensis TaxID=220684 RepID=UPI002FFF984C